MTQDVLSRLDSGLQSLAVSGPVALGRVPFEAYSAADLPLPTGRFRPRTDFLPASSTGDDALDFVRLVGGEQRRAQVPGRVSLGDLGESGRAGGWTFRATTTLAGEDGGGGDRPVLVERMWTPLTGEPAAAATDGQVEVLLDTAAGFSSWLVDRVQMVDPSVPGLGGTVLLRAGITRDVLRPVRLAPDGGRVRVTTVRPDLFGRRFGGHWWLGSRADTVAVAPDKAARLCVQMLGWRERPGVAVREWMA